MSVNLLLRPSETPKIADELESFLHVMVYNAVSHLRSNCSHPSSWITNYFNHYAGPNRMHTCGNKSLAIETSGCLHTFSRDPLLFGSPLDSLFFTILQSFKAHYKVMEHEFRTHATPHPSPSRSPLRKSRSPSPSENTQGYVRGASIPIDPELLAAVEAELETWTLPDNSPTPEDRRLAERLVDHTFIVGLLEKMLKHPRWPESDRITHPRSSSSSSKGVQKSAAPIVVTEHIQPLATASPLNKKPRRAAKPK